MTNTNHRIFVGARFLDLLTLTVLKVTNAPSDPRGLIEADIINGDDGTSAAFDRDAFDNFVKVLPIEASVGDHIVLLGTDFLRDNAPEAIGSTHPVVDVDTQPGFTAIELTVKGEPGYLFVEPHEFVVVSTLPDAENDAGSFEHLDEVVHVNPLGDMPELRSGLRLSDCPAMGEIGQVTHVLPQMPGFVNVVLTRGDKNFLHTGPVSSYRPFFDAFAPVDIEDLDAHDLLSIIKGILDIETTLGIDPTGSAQPSPGAFDKSFLDSVLPKSPLSTANEEAVNVGDLDFDVTASLVVPELLALLRAGKNDAQVLSKQINERVVSLRSSVGDVTAALSRTRATSHLTLSLEEVERVFQGLDNLRNGIALLETLRGNVSMIVDAFDSAAADVADLAARKSVEASNSTVNVFINAPEDIAPEDLMDAIDAALDEGFGGYTEVSKSA